MKHTATQEIKGTSALILGYGREGRSVHVWLQKHYPSLRVAIADKKTDGDAYLEHIGDYDSVIRSPGVSPYSKKMQEYVQQGGHVTTATNIFFSLVRGKTIGVTGTKGKSTTSSLIAHILTAHYADVRLVGNIGTPMLDELDSGNDDTVFVIELSSHQLVDIRYSPHIAVMLRIVFEHLDYYPDFASYVSAKSNIIKYQKPSDVVVYNPKHHEVAAIAQTGKSTRHPFHMENTVMFPTHVLGNAENIAAATTVSRLLGVSESVMKRQLESFTPLPHRLEYVGQYHRIRFYNDSLATIPQATIHALDALGEDVGTLIAGGYDRHLDYRELGLYVGNHPVGALILFPDTGKRIWEVLPERARKQIRVYHVGSMEEAVRLAYAHTPKGNICVLSPGSASYNMFRNYADRGDQFKEWVRKLGSLPSESA